MHNPDTPYFGQSPSYRRESFFGPSTMAQQQRGRDTDRTNTGLLLLIIGILLAPIPYVNYVGGLIIIIGGIVVITGRSSFGPTHSRNTVLAAVIYGVGILILTAIVLGSVFTAVMTATPSAQALSSALTDGLIGAAVGGAILGLAQVLFTYAIQDRLGKTLLWAGYSAGIAVSIVVILILIPEIAAAASQSFTNGFNPAPFNDLQAREQVFMLLGFIPAGFNASAIYLARSRIERGEIPPLLRLGPPPF